MPRNIVDEVAELVGQRPSVLAWGTGEAATVLGLRYAFAVKEDAWRLVGYHTVARGGWRPDVRVLWWEDLDQTMHEVNLDDPGQFPELFRERVNATILADRVVGETGCQARITARRDLADVDARVHWAASPMGATSSTDPAYEQLVEAGIAALRIDYGIG